MSPKYKDIICITFLCLSNTSSAQFGFEKPHESIYYSGWDRGAEGTLYAAWDIFGPSNTSGDRECVEDLEGWSELGGFIGNPLAGNPTTCTLGRYTDLNNTAIDYDFTVTDPNDPNYDSNRGVIDSYTGEYFNIVNDNDSGRDNYTYVRRDETPDGYSQHSTEYNYYSFGVEDYSIPNTPIVIPGAYLIVEPELGIFVTSTNNLYSFSDAPSYDILLLPNDNHKNSAGPVTVAFQIQISGNQIDDGSVKLMGVDTSENHLTYDEKHILHEMGISAHGAPTAYVETLYLWQIDNPQDRYNIRFTAQGSSMSLQAVAIDIGNTTNSSSEVNVPFIPLLANFILAIGLMIITRSATTHKI